MEMNLLNQLLKKRVTRKQEVGMPNQIRVRISTSGNRFAQWTFNKMHDQIIKNRYARSNGCENSYKQR